MGKYRSSATRRQKPADQGPHVIWRGLGCLMIVIIPVISFAFAYELVNYGLDPSMEHSISIAGHSATSLNSFVNQMPFGRYLDALPSSKISMRTPHSAF